MNNKSLKNIALKGVIWSAIDRFASQGISFLVSIGKLEYIVLNFFLDIPFISAYTVHKYKPYLYNK